MKLWASLSLVLVLSTLTFAQDTGSITGTVRDSSGAVIPNAAVAVTNPATSVTRDLTSNSEGDYLAAGLPPGIYDVTVTAKGFQKYHVSGVVLRVAQKARVDANLTVGQAETVITVQGEQVAQVQTQRYSGDKLTIVSRPSRELRWKMWMRAPVWLAKSAIRWIDSTSQTAGRDSR